MVYTKYMEAEKVVLLKKENPAYVNCDAVQKIKERKATGLSIRLFFSDLDASLLVEGDKEMVEETNRARKKLEDEGYIVIWVTSKPSEMAMSSDVYEASVKSGFDRLPPKKTALTLDGQQVFIPMEEYFPTGMLNAPIIIGTTGAEIVVLNDGKYVRDEEYKKNFIKDETETWRNRVDKIIELVNFDGEINIAKNIETIPEYNYGRMDVEPPDFRIPLGFNTPEDFRVFRDRLMLLKMNLRNSGLQVINRDGLTEEDIDGILNTRLVNDSKSNEKIFCYLMPTRGNKARGVEETLQSLSDASGISQEEFEVVYFGDSLTDMGPSFLGGTKLKKKTVVVAGGSRMTKAFTQNENFGDVNFGPIRRRMQKTERKGIYKYKPYVSGQDITLIIGDETYSQTKAPQTINAFLNESYPS